MLETERFDLFVVAAGSATRMEEFTGGFIPKYLLNVDGESIFKKMVTMYATCNENRLGRVAVIVQDEEQKILLKSYCENELGDLGCKFDIMVYPCKVGTYQTIIDMLEPDFYNHPTIVTWCDVCPSSEQDASNIIDDLLECRYNPTVVVDNNPSSNTYRYTTDGVFMKKEDDGANVCGIYLFGDVEETITNLKNTFKKHYLNEFFPHTVYDLCDVLIDFNVLELDSPVFDVGNVRSYNQVNSNYSAVIRDFNEIKFDGNDCIKSTKTEQGKYSLVDEIGWYQEVKKLSKSNANGLLGSYIPEIKEVDKVEGSITMENLNNRPNFMGMEKNFMLPNIKNKIIEDYKYFINYVTSNIQINTRNYDKAIREEYFDVTFDRLTKIPYITGLLGKHTHIQFDGAHPSLQLAELSNIKERLENWIVYYQDIKRGHNPQFIHGDPQIMNLCFANNQLIMFDPKGSFGTEHDLGNYGDPNFDLAKLYYGAFGFGEFVSRKQFQLYTNVSTLSFNLPEINVLERMVSRDVMILIGIIWLRFSYLVRNDIPRAYTSLCIGNALLNKYLV